MHEHVWLSTPGIFTFLLLFNQLFFFIGNEMIGVSKIINTPLNNQ